MKLKKSFRKALAYICVITLVITSITGYRANVNAADEGNPSEVEWQDATASTDNWKENSALAWNMWAGNGSVAQYKNADKVDDFSIKIDTPAGDWSIQAATKVTGLTAGTLYEYTIVVESDREGVRVGTKDDYSNSSLVYTDLVEGRNELKGTLTAAQAAAMMMLELGNGANAGAVITVKGVEVKEHVSQTTIEYGKNITADATWLGWFEAEGWTNYPISEAGTGYTLTDKNIGPNWYSIQTGIDNVEFLEAKYACEFTLTASAPKKFKVDNRSNDTVVFTEDAGAEWTDNGDGTYSYKYKGTFDSAINQFINVRISLGYFAEDENYAANDVTTFTVSDFKIYAVDPNGGETTPAPTEPAPVEKGDVALSGYNWAIQTPNSEGFAPSEYNGYGFTVQGIAADADQWSYGAVLDAIAVTNGETYTLTLNVKSTVNKVVPIEFTNGTAINRTIAATPEGTTFTYKFTAKADTVKIYMPLGINEKDIGITDAYDVTISDVQFDVTEPDETEPITTLPADAEVTILEPAFAFDNSTSTKYYELHWNAVEGAATYTAYVDVEDEDHIATAYHNNWPFNKTGQTYVDHIAGKPGQTQKFIVVAFDADGALLARGIKEITTPELTEEEKAAAAVAAKFNSEDNYAKGATAIVSSGSNAQNLVDGNMASRWQASTEGEDHAAGSEFFGVNLGEVKTIGQVIIAFEASFAAAYDVYVAGADEVYGDTPVASGTADANNLISTVNFDEVDAQFVKVVVTEFSGNASAYGTSVFELAVLPKAEEVTTPETTPVPTEPDTTPVVGDKPAAPAGLAHAPGADGTLPFHFAWGAVEGATSYKVYLNDEYIAEITTQDYNFDETLFTAAGDYTIAVTAVKDGIESDKTAITYTVQGADPGTTPNETNETDTTSASADIVLDQELAAPEEHNNYEVGKYTVYVGGWNGSTAVAGIDAADGNHIKIQQKTCQNWDPWGIQVIKKVTGLTPGETYTYTVEMKASTADGNYKKTGDDTLYPIQESQTVEIQVTATEDGAADFVIGLGGVGLTVVVEIDNPVLKDSKGNVVDMDKPAEPETTTPAEGDTTTPAVAETTTQAPATTEAPKTTTAAPKVTTTKKALGKTTVKSASKKKAATKVKITFKKVKGAKKYQVQISKTKKFKKVLVKKTVKKVKVTIKSKKLKNKKKLYVRVRAVGAKKWSKAKKIKIKK